MENCPPGECVLPSPASDCGVLTRNLHFEPVLAPNLRFRLFFWGHWEAGVWVVRRFVVPGIGKLLSLCLHRLSACVLFWPLWLLTSRKYRFPGRYWKTLLGVGRVIKFSWIITNFMVDRCVYWNRWYLYSARRCVWWFFITALRCITRKI